ncbi:DNA-directed RNA polymerase subunit omega [bacterium]|nr:MAG: DNA-directed RNA polymerase subunit omega [bacterium]
MLPSPDILNDFEQGKFVLSNLAARRAQALAQGAVPLVEVESRHPLTIALAEIAAGKIKPIIGDTRPEILVDPIDTTLLLDDVPSERGVLLPALDEADASLLGDLDDLELESDPEKDEDLSLSLADLGPAEDEPMGGDANQNSDEPEEISLSELGEEEAAGEDGADE